MPSALIAEDDLGHLEVLRKLVEAEGFDVVEADSLAAARSALLSENFDLAVVELRLPDGSGLDLAASLPPGTDIALVTDQGSVETAVEAFRSGAVDYFTKPLETARLRKLLGRARRSAQQRTQISSLRGQLRDFGCFWHMVGRSPAMEEVYDQIQKVAPTDATVLITGETGTGKEVVAATLHELSSRAGKTFCPLNCGAVASSLIESELFGHERGSFTGALRRHEGVFERANGGTLFLDEIAEMPLDLQVKLLRALETREIQRIGSELPLKVDVRVVAATNRDPQLAVSEGKLRQDLFYRLHVFPIRLPPLRERGDDIVLLAEHFVAKQNRMSGTRKRLTRAAAQRLLQHDWPGNVRELENAIERAFIMADTAIEPSCLPLASAPARAADEPLDIRVGTALAEVERIVTLATLDYYGEKKRAAEVLGISLKTLYNRLRGYRA